MSSVEALGWEDGQQAVIEFAGCEHPRPPPLGRVAVSCVAVVVVVVGWLLVVVGCCWLLLVVVGCCWLLLVVVGCGWLLLVVV